VKRGGSLTWQHLASCPTSSPYLKTKKKETCVKVVHLSVGGGSTSKHRLATIESDEENVEVPPRDRLATTPSLQPPTTATH